MKKSHVPCLPSKSEDISRNLVFPLSLFLCPKNFKLFLFATMRATTHSQPRRTLSQVLVYFLIFSTPCVIWYSLCAITHTYSPIVVVTSGSMEPVFRRGDILFVSNRTQSIELGDIVVCWFGGRRLPFVHRVIEKHALPAETRENEKYERLHPC